MSSRKRIKTDDYYTNFIIEVEYLKTGCIDLLEGNVNHIIHKCNLNMWHTTCQTFSTKITQRYDLHKTFTSDMFDEYTGHVKKCPVYVPARDNDVLINGYQSIRDDIMDLLEKHYLPQEHSVDFKLEIINAKILDKRQKIKLS